MKTMNELKMKVEEGLSEEELREMWNERMEMATTLQDEVSILFKIYMTTIWRSRSCLGICSLKVYLSFRFYL